MYMYAIACNSYSVCRICVCALENSRFSYAPTIQSFTYSQFPVSGCDHKNSHFLVHVHVCCNPVCRFMPLILPAPRGLTTLGRWWSGESTPLTLNRCLDTSARGIAFFEVFCVELTAEFTFQNRVAILHPLPPGTAVAATKPLGNFTCTSHFVYACMQCNF